MRDRETIDSELRRLAAQRRSIRERGGQLSSQQLDALLDERLGHPAEALRDTAVLDEIWLPAAEADDRPPRRRQSLLLRLALRAAIPLSLITIAAVVAAMLVMHHRHSTTEPTATPPSDEQASRAAHAPLFPPANHTAPVDIAEKALIDALQHEGVPVPSRDYVTAQGHAVCDFLGRQPSLTEAAHFVQQSTIWDADQSADVTAAAVITYCPQYGTANSDQMQQTFQKSLTNLQAIQGDLQGINHDLQGISDGLPGGR
ncbi:MAG TPA: DUF732 domain-containing protein [Mycobacterium sp.]|jgi:hypothetical protein|uniref:DUF732 domain-containing protein n=1 Tax=Mycobacterium sp. TaxID=1785 RepID=UPI002F41D69E